MNSIAQKTTQVSVSPMPGLALGSQQNTGQVVRTATVQEQVMDLYCGSAVGASLAKFAARTLMLQPVIQAEGAHTIVFAERNGIVGRSSDHYHVVVRQLDAAVCRLTITSNCEGVGPLRSAVIARKVRAFRTAIEQAASDANISFYALKVTVKR